MPPDAAPDAAVSPTPPSAALWHEPAPHHFDLALAWWIKALFIAAATVLAILFLDAPIARWALATHPIPDLADPLASHSDIARELMLLEQWGQWTSTIVVIAAVFLIDPKGRRRALAIAVACLFTVMITYLLKDLCGRSRPYVLGEGLWQWGGPEMGFTRGAKWGSFPSGHTTGAFALAAALSWFYPKARGFFMMLATITAVQRVLHSAHFVSDTIAGMGISVLVTRLTLQAKLPGRLLAILPPPVRDWFLQQNP